jgi:hypothetical protein
MLLHRQESHERFLSKVKQAFEEEFTETGVQNKLFKYV